MKQQIKEVFLILIILLLVYGISYYISYIRYNDYDATLLNALNIENNNLKNELIELKNSVGLNDIKNNVVMTHVIRRNIYNFYNEIVVSNNDFISVGDPIINADGIVGIVSDISDKECIVKLLTGDYNLSVKVNDSYGNLKNDMVTMLDKYKEINVGDKVYTSGLTDIVEGIYVGEVIDVFMNGDDTAKIAKVKLVDNYNLNYVGVVKKS